VERWGKLSANFLINILFKQQKNFKEDSL
jgi:hypothetical protein